jgi:hypothetical protein
MMDEGTIMEKGWKSNYGNVKKVLRTWVLIHHDDYIAIVAVYCAFPPGFIRPDIDSVASLPVLQRKGPAVILAGRPHLVCTRRKKLLLGLVIFLATFIFYQLQGFQAIESESNIGRGQHRQGGMAQQRWYALLTSKYSTRYLKPDFFRIFPTIFPRNQPPAKPSISSGSPMASTASPRLNSIFIYCRTSALISAR